MECNSRLNRTPNHCYHFFLSLRGPLALPETSTSSLLPSPFILNPDGSAFKWRGSNRRATFANTVLIVENPLQRIKAVSEKNATEKGSFDYEQIDCGWSYSSLLVAARCLVVLMISVVRGATYLLPLPHILIKA